MNQSEKAAKMERKLLETQFPLECEDIPLESLNPEEQIVVIKCMQHAELSDEEFSLLKKTLQQYRGAITKYKPSETVEAYEKTKNLIKTEQDWLNIVNNKSNWILKVNVPYLGEWYPMEFEILPLDDSNVIGALTQHVDLFKDYSQEELSIFTKAQQGQAITQEEAMIVERINKEIEAKSSDDRIKSMNNFLASQLRLPDSTEDISTRIEFWEKFPFITKSAIMIKVEDRLGLTDQKNEELFPSGE